jgi:MYXO-CTERM domain-containing protein
MHSHHKPLALLTSLSALLVGASAGAAEYPFTEQRGFGDVYLDGGTPEIVDLDADGDNDILFVGANFTAGTTDVFWFENRDVLGTDLAQHKIDPAVDGHKHAIAADVDGDGDLDVVTSGEEGVRWLENGGEAKVWTAHELDPDRDEVMAAGDVDGDGDVDIVIGDYWDYGVDYFRNDGGGAFTLTTIADLGQSPAAIVCDDFDGDGDADVLVGNEHYLTVYSLEDGPWVPQALDPGTGTVNLRLTDIDQDGDSDVLVGMARSLALLENVDGAFAVEPLADSESIIIDWNADAGDVDHDGDLDVVARGRTPELEDGYLWLEADGGSFATRHPILLDGVSSDAFDLGDLDCDGDPDLVMNYDTSSELILVNATVEADGSGVCGQGGGEGGAGAGGGSGGAGAGGAPGSGGGDETPAGDGGGKTGCSIGAASASDGAWLLLGLAALAWRRRR